MELRLALQINKVVAYMVMACILMAYVVMAYGVMATPSSRALTPRLQISGSCCK